MKSWMTHNRSHTYSEFDFPSTSTPDTGSIRIGRDPRPEKIVALDRSEKESTALIPSSSHLDAFAEERRSTTPHG